MRPSRRRLAAACALAVLGGLLSPAAADASIGVPAPPLAIFGIDVGELVTDIVRTLVDLVLPDFGSKWAAKFVAWLVAIPDLTEAAKYRSLIGYQQGMQATGFGLLGATFCASMLATGLGGVDKIADTARRTLVAAGMLVFYPLAFQLGSRLTNLFTATAIKDPAVVDGLDKLLGAALVLAAANAGLSLGLAVAAAFACAYFIGALIVFKVALTAALAVLFLAGGLVWGLYPLAQTSWLARTWGSLITACLALPVAWALVFSAAALLMRDGLTWGGDGSTPGWLEQVLKVFTAAACLWVAYKTPAWLTSVARTAGLAPGALGGAIGGSGGSGAGSRLSAARGAAASRIPGAQRASVSSSIVRNSDRWRALRSSASAPLRRAGATASIGVRRASGRAVVNGAQRLAPQMAAASTRLGPLGKAANTGVAGARAARGARGWWRDLPQRGAAMRTGPAGAAGGHARPAGESSRKGPQTADGPGSRRGRPSPGARAGAGAAPTPRNAKRANTMQTPGQAGRGAAAPPTPNPQGPRTIKPAPAPAPSKAGRPSGPARSTAASSPSPRPVSGPATKPAGPPGTATTRTRSTPARPSSAATSTRQPPPPQPSARRNPSR